MACLAPERQRNAFGSGSNRNAGPLCFRFQKDLAGLAIKWDGNVYTHALSLGITKRDDGFISIPGRPDSLVRAYEVNLPTIAENQAGYATMLNNNDIIPGGYLKWTPHRWVDAITTAHLTYYVLDQDSDEGYKFYKENKALADSMSKVIGYNFRVVSAKFESVAGGARNAAENAATSSLNITVKNTGVAPCFFDVYLVAEFVDSTGTALAQLGETVRIPKGTFKDGMSQEFSFSGSLPAGGTASSDATAQITIRIALSSTKVKMLSRTVRIPPFGSTTTAFCRMENCC